MQVLAWEPDGVHALIQVAQEQPTLCAAYVLVTGAACQLSVLILQHGSPSLAAWAGTAVLHSFILAGMDELTSAYAAC